MRRCLALATVPAVLACSPRRPPPAVADPQTFCEQVATLHGSWQVALDVLGSSALEDLGARAEHSLRVETDDCGATATLGGAGEERSVELADGGALGLPAAAVAEFGGDGAPLRLVLAVRDSVLSGRFDETASGDRSGLLRGARVGEVSEGAPCVARCLAACDLGEPAAGCVRGCAGIDAPAICGDGEELPPRHRLALEGPFGTLGQHCNARQADAVDRLGVDPSALGFGCRTSLELGGVEIPPLREDRLGGGLLEVKLFETSHGHAGGARELRLAVKTRQGWYLGETVRERPGGSGDADLTRLDVQAVELGPAPGREAVAVAAGGEASVAALCRADGDEPRCAVLRREGEAGVEHARLRPDGRITLRENGAEATYRW